MILTIPVCGTTWEAAATIVLAQALGAELYHLESGDIGGILDTSALAPGKQTIIYDRAYREVEQGKEYYGAVLARTNGLRYEQHRLSLPMPSREGEEIIVCPFGLKKELNLPIVIWSHVFRHIRSYGYAVSMLGDYGQRLNGMLLPENNVLSNLSVKAKLERLAGAKAIIGVPNAWTMLSTAWDKKMVLYQPDDVPERRWTSYIHGGMFYFMYSAQALQVPVFLAATKNLLRRF
jgi:hypothetical protein